jgi:hypothetical protein
MVFQILPNDGDRGKIRSRAGNLNDPTFLIFVSDRRLMKTAQVLATLSLMLAAMTPLQGADDTVTDALVGHWQGSARIVVDWCQQQRLPVAIDINSDGNVTGKIGDATLKNGRLSRNRGWIGRKMNLATDYIIKGDLTGSLVPTEGVTRSSVSIPFDLTNMTLVGGVHTSGTKFGGKKDGILSAASLNLNHAP